MRIRNSVLMRWMMLILMNCLWMVVRWMLPWFIMGYKGRLLILMLRMWAIKLLLGLMLLLLVELLHLLCSFLVRYLVLLVVLSWSYLLSDIVLILLEWNILRGLLLNSEWVLSYLLLSWFWNNGRGQDIIRNNEMLVFKEGFQFFS